MLQIPEPIRRLFETFPLKTFPPAELPEKLIDDSKVLYIGNVDDDSGLCMDPGCLEAQALTALMRSDVRIMQGSQHISKSCLLPYMFERLGNGKIKVSTQKTVVRRLQQQQQQENNGPTKTDVYRSFIEAALGDAWCWTLLDKSQEAAKLRIYLENKQLPAVLTHSLEISQKLLKQLEGRYPAYVAASQSRLSWIKSPDSIEPEVMDRAAECISTLDGILNGQRYLDNEGNSIGPIDVLVFSYTHCICFLESRLSRLLTPSLLEHAQLVRDELGI